MSSAVKVFCFLAAVAMVSGYDVREMMIGKDSAHFQWKNCPTSSPLPLNFTAFSLTPDPLQLGSEAEVSFKAHLAKDIGTTNTVQIDVDAELETYGVQIDVCDYIKDKCHYKDFCSFIKQFKSKCPAVIKKLVPSCQCPLKKDDYSVTKATILLPKVEITVEGILRVKLNVMESGEQVGCLQMSICIGSC